MQYLVTSDEMKRLDEYTIEQIGVPSAVLMERASEAAARRVLSRIGDLNDQAIPPRRPIRVLVLAGSGNNGGDGIACARILHLKEVACDVCLTGDPKHMTVETRRQHQIAHSLDLSFVENPKFDDYEIVVDAMLGIGLSRKVEGRLAALIAQLNASAVYVIAMDISSGISADTGAVLGTAVHANETVTMQYAKPGHYLYPGSDHTGVLTIAEIGVTAYKAEPNPHPIYRIESSDLSKILPERIRSGNKGSFGKVLIAAGSFNMAGAACLASQAVLRSGAGMVKVLTPECNRIILQTAVPEAMLASYRDQEEALTALRTGFAWADIIACGPGLGTGDTAVAILTRILKECTKPLVLDADALNIIAGNDILKQDLAAYTGPVTLTPHMGEMARLTGLSIAQLAEDRFARARAFASAFRVTLVLKDARTVTALPDGRIYLNTSGNDGMATAGSGDVLTGLTAGLMAQGVDPASCGAVAAFVHGAAGDQAAQRVGKASLTAGELIRSFSEVLSVI